MATVEVGCQLRYKNRSVICTSISKTTETCYAPRSSDIMRSEVAELSNVEYLAQTWDDFSEGDIITIDAQRVQFTEVGKTLFFIYTYYNVKKEGLNGSEGTEASNREASHVEAETDRHGDQGRESTGLPCPDQDGYPAYGDGPGGGGGEDSGARMGQEGEYPSAYDWSGHPRGPGC